MKKIRARKTGDREVEGKRGELGLDAEAILTSQAPCKDRVAKTLEGQEKKKNGSCYAGIGMSDKKGKRILRGGRRRRRDKGERPISVFRMHLASGNETRELPKGEGGHWRNGMRRQKKKLHV